MAAATRMSNLAAHRLWLLAFALWACFLSGAFASILGGPGVIQALRLRSLLKSKNTQIQMLENRISQFDGELTRLEKNRINQEREIRRTLGYVASDEIIFEFGGPDRKGQTHTP